MKIKWLNPLLLWTMPAIGTSYTQIVAATSRLVVLGPNGEIRKSDFFAWPEGVIYCSWHSRFFYFCDFGRGSRVITMISASKDGEIITRLINKRRMYAVRGSSSRGGKEALFGLAKALAQKHKVYMLPDGPRGPRQIAKIGTIQLAQMSGKPILPISTSASKGVFLPTWDRFLIPFLCCKVVVTVGNPIYVPPDLSPEEMEAYRLQLQNALDEVLARADIACGRNPEQEATRRWGKKR